MSIKMTLSPAVSVAMVQYNSLDRLVRNKIDGGTVLYIFQTYVRYIQHLKVFDSERRLSNSGTVIDYSLVILCFIGCNALFF